MKLFGRIITSARQKRELSKLLGFRPKDLSFYHLAFIDPALRNEDDPNRIDTNDRLEFLGDSILGMIISKFLYQKMPHFPVGKLSAFKARIVSRQVNNNVAESLGLPQFLEKKQHVLFGKDALGNALEALIAAIYLDRGIVWAEYFVYNKLIPLYKEMHDEGSDLARNFKGELQLWTDKQARRIRYETSSARRGKSPRFIAKVFIDGKNWGEGEGASKKEAEQEAARQVLSRLGKIAENQ